MVTCSPVVLPSCSPVTVTVCALFQSVLVKVRDGGATVTAAVSPLLTSTVRGNRADGADANVTSKFAVAPSVSGTRRR